MRLISVGGFTLDDVVTVRGEVHRGVPGGNALYAALGAHLWGHVAAPLTFAGADHPPELLDRLADAGIETGLIRTLPTPSIRLWVLYESDGRRQIHYQHGSGHLSELLPVVERTLGPGLDASRGETVVHVAALPVSLQRPVLDHARSLGTPITLDSIEARGSVGGDLADYWRSGVLQGVDAFLPSREEVAVIQGDRTAAGAVDALMAAGVRTIAIKDGERGCTVYRAGGAAVHVPAFRVSVVDPTGAGDVFCGAFAVTLAATGDAVEAALHGCVAASFVVEGVGGLHVLQRSRDEADGRLERLRSTLREEGAHALV